MAVVKIKGPRTKANITVTLKTNVYEEAKIRIKKILAQFDSIIVAFSGGKDSLVVVHLVKEVYEELGIKKKVKVVFRDEELIPDAVINFVNEYRQKDWVDLDWYCVPLKSQKYLLGKSYSYIQWDADRDWVRELPSWGIREERVYDQYTMDDRIARDLKGKVCILTGIRASESIVRLQAVTNKINETYVCATKSKRVMLGRPVYDWEEDDVFKYFHDNKVPYCSHYDDQLYNGEQLRVATPFLTEGAKKLSHVKTRNPEFWDRLLKVFPEMEMQARYYKSIDKYAIEDNYKKTIQGLYDYINDNITGDQKDLAINRFNMFVAMNKKDPQSYPISHAFRVFINGDHKRAYAFFKGRKHNKENQ